MTFSVRIPELRERDMTFLTVEAVVKGVKVYQVNQCNTDQHFRPERPVQHSIPGLDCRPLDQHIYGPKDAKH